MALWLCYRWREIEPPYRPLLRAKRLDGPCPTITSTGIGGSSWMECWLEECDVAPRGSVVTRNRRAKVTAERPPYRVPLLEEIRALPWNGLTTASVFAGCGGSSTGYRLAGYRVLAAVEFVPAAQESYAANKAEYTTLLRRDIREVTAEDLLRACGLERGQLDVLDGSPPCEPFSTAGGRERTWGHEREYSGQHQRTDDLFYEYTRLLEGMQPRAFVAENVTGLVKGRAKGYFLRITEALRACGYRVETRILDASWMGVPQARQRVIFSGIRNDLERAPAWPAPLPYQYSVRDAIGDLLSPGAEARMGSFRNKQNPPEITDQPAPTLVAGDATYWHVDEPVALIRDTHSPQPGWPIMRYPVDGPAPTLTTRAGDHWELEYDQQIIGNDRFEPQFGSLESPHPTIMAEGARTSGELRSSQTGQRRRFTIAEAKRICGFPDDYELVGSFYQQWERLGDAVPPPMMERMAAALRDGPLAA